MKLARIGKQLQREAKANPKKAAFLGVATLVACYFWLPLIWGWIAKGDQEGATSTATTAAPSSSPAGSVPQPQATAANATQSVVKQASWAEVLEGMQNDPRTTTAPPLAISRDPFGPAKRQLADQQAAEKKANAEQIISPSAAGLVLTGTIIGQDRPLAQISGRTYAVGQAIEVVGDKVTRGVKFTLIEVRLRSVVLESEGRHYELGIPEPAESGRIQLSDSSEKK